MIAFWLGRGSGSDGSAETAGVEQEALACSKKLGLPGVEKFLQTKGEDGAPLLDQLTGRLAESIYSEVIECSDLNGDGVKEMVLIADGVGAGGSHPVSWFILEQREGRWEGVFRRTVPTPQIEVQGQGVQESTPGYLEDAPLGMPSYRRVGKVAPKGTSYGYVPSGQGSLDRKLTVSPENRIVTRIGTLDVMTLGPREARNAFGRPSTFSWFDDDICPTTWSDLGLTINFVNLGGLDACEVGLVGSFELAGSPAETSGWVAPRGVRIGMTFNDVAKRFPSTARSEYPPVDLPDGWESFTLLTGTTIYSDSVPTVTGLFEGKFLKQLIFFIGAGGD